jgi:hypothetical protein
VEIYGRMISFFLLRTNATGLWTFKHIVVIGIHVKCIVNIDASQVVGLFNLEMCGHCKYHWVLASELKIMICYENSLTREKSNKNFNVPRGKCHVHKFF